MLHPRRKVFCPSVKAYQNKSSKEHFWRILQPLCKLFLKTVDVLGIMHQYDKVFKRNERIMRKYGQ